MSRLSITPHASYGGNHKIGLIAYLRHCERSEAISGNKLKIASIGQARGALRPVSDLAMMEREGLRLSVLTEML